MHLVRVRELIGAAGDRVDNLHGICAGLSLYDTVSASGEVGINGVSNENPPTNGIGPHPLAAYDLSAPGSIQTILPKKPEILPKTLKSLSLSPWNAPPYHLRQRGHLLYLQVTTNEGEQHQITSHVAGFYVNKCSNTKFDPFPRPAPKNHSAHSLLNLISLLSPAFNSAFLALQEANNKKDLLAAFPFQNAIPCNPWIVPSATDPITAHHSDLTRTQETLLIAGVDNAETLRDWNEEFQSTRELPRETVQDRVFRERLTSKLFADYNDAAARGAVLVARGEVAPLNPTEGKDAQIFVYNNIFYSFGADGVGTFATEGGDEAARVAVGKDVMGVKAVNQLDIPGLFTPGTVVVDYLGKRLVGQSIVPGIFKQREPGEYQIDYGGVEGKEIVAKNETFVPVFEKLSKALRVKKHPVWDKDGKRHDLEGSVETKGLLGTDGRKYVLDLYRIAPLDVAWSEQETPADHEVYPHRMAILRLELVEAYWRLKMSQYVKEEVERRRRSRESEGQTTDSPADEINGPINGHIEGPDGHIAAPKPEENVDSERVDISEFKLALNPDVCSGQAPQTEEEKEELSQDENEVRHACEYLTAKIIPELIQDLHDGDVGFPMDGQSLSQLLHKRGINIRYLGRLAILAQEKGTRLQALTTLAKQEMISRAFKHTTNKYLRHLPAPFGSSCIAHLLNCLLGTELNSDPRPEIDESLRELYPDGDFSFEKVNPTTLKAVIESQVRLRYRYTLDSDWNDSLKRLHMLREISLKLGLQLGAKNFEFKKLPSAPVDEHLPIMNGRPIINEVSHEETKKKKKKGTDQACFNDSTSSLRASTTFTPEDVLNVVPLVKDAAPRSALAEEALEAGRLSIMQGQKQLGQELVLESLSLHEQIYGILHHEVAKMYHQLSMLYYQMEEKDAAVELARKAVIVTERTLGVDSSDAIISYLNLSLLEHATGNTKTALEYIRHALDIWKIIFGPNHPDSITTMNNAAVMLQQLKHYADSRRWFESSLAICEEIFGKQSINTATILFQLAQALVLDQDARGAVKRMREAYSIFLSELGANDRNTKEAESWLEQLTQNAVSVAKQAKDIQARRFRRIHLTPRVSLGTRPQPQVGQSSADAGGRRDPRSSIGLDSRSIDELLKFIEGGESSSPRSQQKKRVAASNPKLRLAKQSAVPAS